MRTIIDIYRSSVPSRTWIADAAGLYLSATVRRDSRTNPIAIAAFGKAWLNNINARNSSIASWTMTQMRGFWELRLTLLEPGIMNKSVSLEDTV